MSKCAIALLAVALAGMPSGANATIQCLADAGARIYTCIDDGDVRVNGFVRASRIHMGDARQLRETPYWLVAHCKRNVHTLQNDDGIDLKLFDLTTATWRLLAIWLCGVDRPLKRDPKLKML